MTQYRKTLRGWLSSLKPPRHLRMAGYRVASTVNSACPLPVLGPLVQLIQEVENLLTESSSIQSESQKLIDELTVLKGFIERRIGQDEDLVTELPNTKELIEQVARILDALKGDLRSWKECRTRVQLYQLDAMKDRLKKHRADFKDAIRNYHVGCSITSETSPREKIDRSLLRVDYTKVKNIEHFDTSEEYVKGTLPILLGEECLRELADDLLVNDKVKFLPMECRVEGCVGSWIQPTLRLAECWRKDTHQVILVRIYSDFSQRTISDYLRELQISRIMDHSHIVQFYGLNTTINRALTQTLNLVSEYCSEGFVEDYLTRSRCKTPDVIRLMYEVALAVEYLHSGAAGGKVIIHGDIRPSKILVSLDGRAKLTSFRRSQIVADAYEKASRFSSNRDNHYRWRAPEALPEEGRQERYQVESDVYAWGLVATRLLCTDWVRVGQLQKFHKGYAPVPYGLERPDSSMPRFIREGSTPPYEDVLLEKSIKNQDLRALLKQSWAHNHRDRPVISEVVARMKVIGGYDDNSKLVPNRTTPTLPTPPSTPPEQVVVLSSEQDPMSLIS